MLLGISSFTYGWNVGLDGFEPVAPFTEIHLIQKLKAFKLHCLQIGDNLPVEHFDEDRKQGLKTLIRQGQIRLELGARGLTAKNLEKHIDLCAYFGSPLLRFVIDSPGYEPGQDLVINLIRDYLPVLKKHHITLGIENHDRFKARELATMMEKVGSENVGICLDCVNSIGAAEGLGHVAGILAPYTVNLHVKDFSIKRLPHKMGFTVVGEIAGRGMTDLPWLLEAVTKHGRCQSAILEQWVPPADDMEQTCRREVEWAEQSMAYVQSVINVNKINKPY